MNILIINHYAGSLEYGMEFRPYYLAKKWQEAGHKVFILTADFAHTRSTQPEITYDLETSTISDIQYIWLRTPKYSGNGIQRIRNMYSFVRKLKRYHKSIAKMTDADIVIASSTYPLDNYSAKRIANHSGGKIIYEIHDLWPLSPMELGGYSKNHPFIRIMQKAENFAYANADAIVSILPCIESHVTSHGLDAKKLHIVPNGIWLEDWESAPEIPAKHKLEIEKAKQAGKTCVAYTGAHGVPNILDNLLQAAAKLEKQSFHFFLVGNGSEKARLMDMTKTMQLKHVSFLDAIPKTMIPQLLKRFDILYLGLKNQSLFRFGIGPNKLFDYMMAEKPIVMAIDAGNDIVSDANCGYTIPPENPEALANALQKMKNLSENEKTSIGKNGKSYVLQHHEYTVLAKQFLKIMENLTETHQSE